MLLSSYFLQSLYLLLGPTTRRTDVVGVIDNIPIVPGVEALVMECRLKHQKKILPYRQILQRTLISENEDVEDHEGYNVPLIN